MRNHEACARVCVVPCVCACLRYVSLLAVHPATSFVYGVNGLHADQDVNFDLSLQLFLADFLTDINPATYIHTYKHISLPTYMQT